MQKLPSIVETYFEASNRQDVELYVSCFTSDATIKDNDEIIQGHEDITSWNHEINRKYSSVTKVKSWVQTSNGTDVTTEVSGTFPGSPIELTFHFELQDEKIKKLEIK